ncbi:hypothetical protein [Moorella sp. ACPs]|uniref:hypothetical protein n=1 Tax=Neomoorella carbonis TaxID=3062783 RepID=UPI003256343C
MAKQLRHIIATIILLLLMYLILSQTLYNNLPSTFSRLFIFVILGLIVFSLYLSTELTLIIIPFLNYFYNQYLLSIPFSTNISETASLAQQYEVGRIFYSNAHSYFFSSPYLIYMVHKLTGLNYINSKDALVFLVLVFISCMGIYFYRTLQGNDKIFVKIASATLISFSFTISPSLGYREMGTFLFLLAMIYWLKHYNKGIKDILCFIILVAGASIGSSMSCILAIFIFGIITILNRKANPYLIISSSWMIYAGYLYLMYLKSYIYSAWSGIYDFVKSLLKFHFEERVIPFARTTVWLPIDTFFLSISYIATIILVILCLYCYIKSIQKNKNLNPISMAVFLTSIFLLLIGTGTYIGASVMPEKTFSDIRTIAISFLFIILPLLFIAIISEIRGKLIYIFIIILLIASSRSLFVVYPKSAQDPINVLEDIRVSDENTVRVVDFIKTKVSPDKQIYSDYKIGLFLGALLSTSKLCIYYSYPYGSIIAYNKMGRQFESLYIKKDIYNRLDYIADRSNVFYDNGLDVILQYSFITT